MPCRYTWIKRIAQANTSVRYFVRQVTTAAAIYRNTIFKLAVRTRFIGFFKPAFIKKAATPKWLVRDFIFSLQGKSRKYAAYKQFVEYENNKEISAFYGAKKLFSVLGGDEFIQNIKGYIEKSDNEKSVVVQRRSTDDVVAYLAKYFFIDAHDIVTVKKGRKEKSLPRMFAIKLCQDLTGQNLKALAVVFNVQHYSAISQTVCRLNKLIIADDKVKLQFEKLRDSLMYAVKV